MTSYIRGAGRKLLLLFGVAVSVSSLLALWLSWSFRQPSYPKETFDAKAWKEAVVALRASNDPDCLRGGMALDLIESRQLVGKTETQMREYLGGPEQESTSVWLYELGQCSGWGWAHSELKVEFDPDIRVVSRASFLHLSRD